MTFLEKCQRGLIKYGVVPMIRLYRVVISPLLGARCRFVPSCSEYAEEAICRHGLLKGGWMALRRLVRCHPLNPGGEDPVPQKKLQVGSPSVDG